MHTSKRASRFANRPAPSVVRDVVSSPGRSLESTTRALMEPRFSRNRGVPFETTSSESIPSRLGISDSGHSSERNADYLATSALNDYGASSFGERGVDFGHVRIHTDSRAAQSARELNVPAYSVGRHIVFGAGQYAPETPFGQRVLAHELAHVAQHSSVAADSAQVHRFTPFTPEQQAADQSLGWKHPAGSKLRVADDGQMAAEDNDWGPGTSKRAWTLPAKIAESNDILGKQGSRAKLRAKSGGVDITGHSPDSGESVTLNEIEPYREGGGKFNLASDCGTAARQVTGSEPSGDFGAGLGGFLGFVGGGAGGAGIGYGIAKGSKYEGLGAAIGAAVGAIGGLIGGYFAGQAIDKAASRKKDAPVVHGASGEEEALTPRPYHGGNPTTPEEYSEEIFKKEFGANLSRSEAYAKYAALSPTDKDAFDRKYGINKYAVPRVGQALTISTEKDMPGYSDASGFTWNFHYAATVLRSGNDFITLESAAGWDADDWIFFMYGPESKGQSFHEYQGATLSHGTKYQTYVVQPEK